MRIAEKLFTQLHGQDSVGLEFDDLFDFAVAVLAVGTNSESGATPPTEAYPHNSWEISLPYIIVRLKRFRFNTYRRGLVRVSHFLQEMFGPSLLGI